MTTVEALVSDGREEPRWAWVYLVPLFALNAVGAYVTCVAQSVRPRRRRRPI